MAKSPIITTLITVNLLILSQCVYHRIHSEEECFYCLNNAHQRVCKSEIYNTHTCCDLFSKDHACDDETRDFECSNHDAYKNSIAKYSLCPISRFYCDGYIYTLTHNE